MFSPDTTVSIDQLNVHIAVIRFLYFERNVLHRDISRGNVMFPTQSARPHGEGVDRAKQLQVQSSDMCCVKYLLEMYVLSNPAKRLLYEK